MSPYRRNIITRLNLLLAFAQRKDINELSNGQWEKVRRDLVYVIYNRKDVRDDDRAFMKIVPILDAQRHLLSAINNLKNVGVAHLHFNQQSVIIATVKGKPFSYRYQPDDLSTALNGSLAYLLDKSEITREELLECANPTCQFPDMPRLRRVREEMGLPPPRSGKIFVPIRKPAKSKRAYCSTACARVVAVRDYRDRLRSDAQKYERAKEKERKRGKQRYRKKVLKK
jgi:hypothetical protein